MFVRLCRRTPSGLGCAEPTSPAGCGGGTRGGGTRGGSTRGGGTRGGGLFGLVCVREGGGWRPHPVRRRRTTFPAGAGKELGIGRGVEGWVWFRGCLGVHRRDLPEADATGFLWLCVCVCMCLCVCAHHRPFRLVARVFGGAGCGVDGIVLGCCDGSSAAWPSARVLRTDAVIGGGFLCAVGLKRGYAEVAEGAEDAEKRGRWVGCGFLGYAGGGEDGCEAAEILLCPSGQSRAPRFFRDRQLHRWVGVRRSIRVCRR